jgi:uncharacterized tellurite resistance protein B-like protein
MVRSQFAALEDEDRLRLLRFLCSFAWADLAINESERGLVQRLMGQLDLTADEHEQVEEWLRIPPAPEDIDPTDVPAEHRQLFLDMALQMVGADGHLSEQELETLQLFEKLLPQG